MKKVLVFNLSGALLMPTDEVIKIWCDAIRSVGLRPNLTRIFQLYDESWRDVIIPDLATSGKWTESEVCNICNYANNVFMDINTSTSIDLSEKLAKLKKNGYLLAVLTDKTKAKLVSSLKKINCDDSLFDFNLTSDSGFKKPDPRVLDEILKKHQPEEILMIGQDYHRDFILARKARIEFVAIVSGLFPPSFWESMMPGNKNIYISVKDFLLKFE